ncbi:MAG TPA: hypothetical protein VGD24_07045 [Gallionella sp.]
MSKVKVKRAIASGWSPNYRKADGSVKMPDVMHYLGWLEKLSK